MKYEIDEIIHPGWLKRCPWYNTDICSKLHEKMCEYFIPHARTDRYHRMCPIFSHDKKQPSYEDEEISIGDRPIPNNTTTEILEALGTNLNFIDIWFERLDHNYDF